MSKGEFFIGSKAHDGDEHIIYNAKNGRLFFDDDGKGRDAKVPFAVLDDHLHLEGRTPHGGLTGTRATGTPAVAGSVDPEPSNLPGLLGLANGVSRDYHHRLSRNAEPTGGTMDETHLGSLLVVVLSRATERILLVLVGALAVYLGYSLFLHIPTANRSEGKIDLPGGVSIFLTRIGPGVFFALFGVAVIGYSVTRPDSVHAADRSERIGTGRFLGPRRIECVAAGGGDPDFGRGPDA